MSDATSPPSPPPTPSPVGFLGAARHAVGVAFPVLSFVAGFLWDVLTLGRVDSWKDDLLLALYLATLGGLLALEMRLDGGRIRAPFLVRHAAWVSWSAQFLFGGLYSAFIVFYFRSAFSWVSFLFLGGLFALAVITEFREHAVRPARLRSALYWLAAYNLMLLLVPVLTGWLGAGLGVVAALFATGAAAGVVALGAGAAALRPHAAGWALVAALLFTADFLGVIPPVPMALMDVGVFHDVQATRQGYALTYDDPPWYRPFVDDDRRFHLRKGDRIWTFTRVFGPTGLRVGLIYVYERSTAWVGGWQEVSRSSMTINGGRDLGFRGFSYTRHGAPGAWRVRVLLENGRELGRYSFVVVEDESIAPPDRVTRYDR